jgi:hypothetical protein
MTVTFKRYTLLLRDDTIHIAVCHTLNIFSMLQFAEVYNDVEEELITKDSQFYIESQSMRCFENSKLKCWRLTCTYFKRDDI